MCIRDSLRVDDNEFAEELLKIHINEVSEDFRENLYNFCMCGYLIHKKKFKEALSYNVKAVSYTHLDVYKRQSSTCPFVLFSFAI